MKSFRKFILEVDEFRPTHEGYHGTPDARGIRKEGFKTLKQRHTGKDDQEVHWAAVNHQVAKSYADPHRAFDYQNSEPEVLPVQLSMKNPKVINWNGKKFHHKDEQGNWHHIDHHIEQARKDGHDGFVIHRIIDSYEAKGKPSTIMGVFNSKNIRIKPTNK